MGMGGIYMGGTGGVGVGERVGGWTEIIDHSSFIIDH